MINLRGPIFGQQEFEKEKREKDFSTEESSDRDPTGIPGTGNSTHMTQRPESMNCLWSCKQFCVTEDRISKRKGREMRSQR